MTVDLTRTRTPAALRSNSFRLPERSLGKSEDKVSTVRSFDLTHTLKRSWVRYQRVNLPNASSSGHRGSAFSETSSGNSERSCSRDAERGSTTQEQTRSFSNAIGILVHLGDRTVVELTRKLRDSGNLRALAWAVPTLLDARESRNQFESTTGDPAVDAETRIMAATVALSLGANGDQLLQDARQADPEHVSGTDFFFHPLAAMHPFPAAIGLISDALDRGDDRLLRLTAPVIKRVAELDVPGLTDLLLRAIESRSSEVMTFALFALQNRRSTKALTPLLKFAQKSEGKVAEVAINSAIASGPTGDDGFAELWPKCSNSFARSVLAARRPLSSEVPWLVQTGIGPDAHWNRRSALLALGYVPDDGNALTSIAPGVLAEQCSLPDQDVAMTAHSWLSAILKGQHRGRCQNVRPRTNVFLGRLEISLRKLASAGPDEPSHPRRCNRRRVALERAQRRRHRSFSGQSHRRGPESAARSDARRCRASRTPQAAKNRRA